MANQVFVRYGAAPTSANFDATHDGPLSSNLAAIVPSTEPGKYFVLVRGFSGQADGANVSLLARLMPLSITDIHTDVAAREKKILYEATGKPYILYVAVSDVNGARLTRGAAFNHYEFTDSIDGRLTDEDWQTEVYGGGDLPEEDKWSREIKK